MALFQLECPSSKFLRACHCMASPLLGPGSERSRAWVFLPIFPSFVLLHLLGPFLPTFWEKPRPPTAGSGCAPTAVGGSTPDSHFLLSWPTVDFYRPLPSFFFLGRDPRDPDPAFFAQFFPSAPFSWIPLFYPVSTPGSHFQLPSPSSNLIAPMTTSQFFVLPRAGIENPDPALNFGLPIWRAGFFSLNLLLCSLRPSLKNCSLGQPPSECSHRPLPSFMPHLLVFRAKPPSYGENRTAGGGRAGIEIPALIFAFFSFRASRLASRLSSFFFFYALLSLIAPMAGVPLSTGRGKPQAPKARRGEPLAPLALWPTFNFHGPLPTYGFFMGGIFRIPTLPFYRPLPPCPRRWEFRPISPFLFFFCFRDSRLASRLSSFTAL